MKCVVHELTYAAAICPLCTLDRLSTESDEWIPALPVGQLTGTITGMRPPYPHWRDRGQIPPCAEYPRGWPPGEYKPASASASDTQVGGDHYTKLAIQPMAFSMTNNLDALQHTIVKYVVRFRDKNGIEDLKKARHCIDMLIEHETKLQDNSK